MITHPNAFCQFAESWQEVGTFCLPDDDMAFASAAWDEALLKVSEALWSEAKDLTPLAIAIIQTHISNLHTWRPGKPSLLN